MVLAEGDILDGGSNYSETKRNVRILNKTSISNPSVEDLLPGEMFVNVSEGKIFTLKNSQDGKIWTPQDLMAWKNPALDPNATPETGGGGEFEEEKKEE